MKRSLRISVLLAIVMASVVSFAEPWLATRFAQNCSACHAPGRVNVPAKNRRCTLSCQGCHTNPNGGGLRNFYGKWTQERWLNSAYFKDYKLNKPRPAPTSEQSYADDKIKQLATDKEKEKKVAEFGYRLHEVNGYANEKLYDRRSTHERFVEPDPDLAKARIPDEDPWRERREEFFNAGIDSRYFYLDETKTTGAVAVKVNNAIPMANDLAVSLEPVHRMNLVLESRFLNPPTDPAWDGSLETESRIRSAYLMVDDLPYNSFVMAGLYRPMFGNYSPDHTSLFSKVTGLDQRAVFKAFTFGTAPNVPFLNVHMIQPMNNTAYSQDKGYAVNVGARFVTLGAYGMLSYWNTSSTLLAATTNKNMYGWTGGMTYKKYTAVGDVTQVKLQNVGVNSNTGLVITLENRYRVWRENYAKFIVENINTARDLNPGSTSAYSIGFNAFLISSLEFELIYRTISETENGVSTSEKATWAQLHLFF